VSNLTGEVGVPDRPAGPRSRLAGSPGPPAEAEGEAGQPGRQPGFDPLGWN
jgi:hypothetical protein